MKVLLSLMKLDIGGAETHVIELAKELHRRGWEVIVTSNGGAFVKELEDFGIKHYSVPLQNKNPKNVMKAFRLLKQIIEDENVDIVHSHARIPSFILGKLHKKMGFPFVTTAHWVFTTKYGLKYITDWGQKTVAVSEDIKEYLMVNYKMPESDITVTINGIDTDKFSPETDRKPAMEEFGLNDSDNTIVYVSRMDESRSLVAHHLIEAIKRLDPIVENLKAVIVGDGDDFAKVKAEAEAVNSELGREAIMLAGARVDIAGLIAPCKLFVGVSRAALEAMAEAKPVIVAGNEGYIGTFGEDKLQEALDTNFCCRGCGDSTADKLAQDIGEFFGMWQEDRDKLGQFGRNLILENYSVKRMTDDNESVYKKVLGI